MEISESEKRLFTIFNDLKKDRMKDGKIINLIDKNRILISTNNTINFQGDHLRKQIKYNPNFFHNHLSKLNDNVTRFILLHEESHLSKGKNHLFLLFIPLMTIILVSILITYSPINVQVVIQENIFSISSSFLGVLFFIIAILIVVPVSWRILWDSMVDEEINSDLYGAGGLVDFFQEHDPARIVSEFLFVEPTKKEAHRIKILIIVMKIFGTYPDYHPSSYTRIEKIRERFPTNYSLKLKL